YKGLHGYELQTFGYPLAQKGQSGRFSLTVFLICAGKRGGAVAGLKFKFENLKIKILFGEKLRVSLEEKCETVRGLFAWK
ncbi:hypothetical protein D478_23618, partial [Brevibacillus agri BAB-2500]